MLPTLTLPVAAAAPAAESLVFDIGFSFFFAWLLAALFARFRIPTIAAYLLAGVLVGPLVTGLVTSQANIETISHLGLVLLLFLIGLEINIPKLLASGKTLVLTGLLQFPLCVLFGASVAWLVQQTGWQAVQGPFVPLYTGIVIAASSTLLIVKLFQDKYQLDSTVGRLALGILIFQDLWAMVVLTVQPNFSQPDLVPVLMTFLGILLLGGFAVLFARYVLPVVFQWIARSPELMLVSALGWCFGIALLGDNLDDIVVSFGLHVPMNVSLEMGALIAGAAIASLPYSYEVVSKVTAVRDFFVTLFFVGLGMGIPRPEGMDVLLFAALIAALAIASRALVFFPTLFATGLDRRASFVASLRLLPISEFGLVIAYLGLSFGHISAETVAAIIFAFVITALIFPMLFEKSDRLYVRVAPLLTRLGIKPPTDSRQEETADSDVEIVILGFHRVASSLFHEIEHTDPERLKKVRVVDFNVALHPEIQNRGAMACYGDISNLETLRHAGVDKANLIICTVPDDLLKGTNNHALTCNLRAMNPEAVIITNAVKTTEVPLLYEAGADYVFLPRLDSAKHLLPVIEAAANGAMKAYLENEDFLEGRVAQRREVLP